MDSTAHGAPVARGRARNDALVDVNAYAKGGAALRLSVPLGEEEEGVNGDERGDGLFASAASRVCSSQDLEAQQACRSATIAQMQAPVNAAIARADTGERYADASVKEPRPQVGN